MDDNFNIMDEDLIKEHEDAFTYHFFFNHGYIDELFHFEDLINETESFLASKKISFKNSKDEEILDERFGKQIQYENIFPIILWKSLFLSIYFSFESSLDQICNNLRKSNLYTLSLNDINGSGIFRSSLYLKKVCSINESFKTNTWASITAYNKIRNTLVHSDGYFSKSNVELAKICLAQKEINLVEYENTGYIIEFNEEYCKIALNTIRCFVYEIQNEMINVRANNQ